jgi:biopolymer transport protein ExbD
LSSQNSEALYFAIQRVLRGSDRPIVIQSDAGSPVQSLVTAMDVVARLGMTQVSIATTRPIE